MEGIKKEKKKFKVILDHRASSSWVWAMAKLGLWAGVSWCELFSGYRCVADEVPVLHEGRENHRGAWMEPRLSVGPKAARP